MRMFTKLGVTVASGALPVLLWAGAASAQEDPQSPQSPQSPDTTAGTTPLPTTTGGGGGTLARTGAEDLLPLALGGAAVTGAVVVRRGIRRRSA